MREDRRMNPQTLRDQTRSEHEATEALLPLMHAGLTRQEYVAALLALQPVVESWEAWAAAWAPGEFQAVVQARQRGALLRADLARLEVGGEAPGPGADVDWNAVVRDGEEAGPALPGTHTFAAGFLGALYVVEGSTLGGRHIARHVVAVLGAAYEPATQYFCGHGDGTGAMWREVMGYLAEIPDSLTAVTVAAARRTFGVFGRSFGVKVPDSATASH